MTNVKNKRGGKSILKVICTIFLLLISTGFVAIAVQICKHMIQEKRNNEYKQNYPHEIQTYLQDKYGKTFYINPKSKTNPGGPLPGRSYTPHFYEIWEADRSGYVFNVCIYPESAYDDKIKEIQDNYCWKFLNIKTKEWFQNELEEVLPQDYKFILYSMYSSIYFDDDKYDKNINPDLPLEGYYETRISPVPLTLDIVVPPNALSQTKGEIEDEIKKVINKFYTNNPNSTIEFRLSQAKTRRDYEKIIVKELENSHFYLYREWIFLRDIADIETKIEIKVGQRD